MFLIKFKQIAAMNLIILDKNNYLCFIDQLNHVLEFNYGESLATNSIKKFNMPTYFENLTLRLHVIYVFNTYVKFCVNLILFTICP